MSDGREERAEQEARRQWENSRRPAEDDTPPDYERDGAAERNAS